MELIEYIKLAISITGGFMAIGATVFAWFTSRSKANAEQIHEIEKNMTEIESRIVRIEGELAHIPSKEMVHRLEVALTEIRGEVTATSRTVHRMEEFLTRKAQGHE